MKNLYSRQDLKKIEEADSKSRQETNTELDSSTNQEESKSKETVQNIENARKQQRP